MKKIITVLCSLVLLSSALSAKNFFEKRYFEFFAGVPVDVSNNVVGMSDIFQKEIVLDLTQIANDMPKEGLTVIADVNPIMGFNLNVPLFSLGMEAGADVYGNFNLGKGLFDLLGKGYESGDTLSVGMDFDADIFLTTGVKGGFKIGFFKIEVNPSVFLPIIHISPESAEVTVTNSEDGKVSMQAKAKVNTYSIVDLSGFDMKALTEIPSQIGSSMGFDLAGSVHFTYFDNLDLWGTVRIPIVPGHLKYKASIGATAEYNQDMNKMIKEKVTSNNSATSTDANANTEESTEQKEGFEYTMDDISKIKFVELDEKYYINRPLKLDVYANYALVPGFVDFTGGLGIGIRNPFASTISEVKVYPEYYLSSRVGMANMVALTASTEYTDQIFRHQLALKLNVRIIEVDVGASLQSSNFVSSFKVSGLGAFVNCYIGF